MRKENDVCVGFVEFDDIEGPIITYQYPPNFPLDAETSFEIADFSLYVEGKTQFEIRDYVVISYPFKVMDEKYARKFRKYALVIIVAKDAWKSKFEMVLLEIGDDIIKIIESMKRKMKLHKNITAFVDTIYSLVSKKFGEEQSVDKNYIVRQPRFEEENLKKISENMIIVDFRLKYLICIDRSIIDEFISNPKDFSIIFSTNKTLIAIIRKDIIALYDGIIENMKNIMNHFEKNGLIISSLL